VFGKELTAGDTVHTPETTEYRRTFAQLADQATALGQAAAQLEFRLSGGIDPAMSYMRATAYGKPTEAPPSAVRGATVVFLHDFYDSPHIYHDLVFDDFWQWVTFTISALRDAGVPSSSSRIRTRSPSAATPCGRCARHIPFCASFHPV
jgi:hypothetical protein